MLRRRKTSSKHVKRTPHSAPRPAGRRRARPDATVPEALIVRPEHIEPTPEPAPIPEVPAATARPPRRDKPRPRAEAARDVVLVTGFDPFGGERTNPSWEICTRLPREIAGMRVEVCRVPCEFRRAIEVVAGCIEQHRPAIVLSLGQAGGRAHLTVERVAINVDDARIADNGGAEPVDEPIAANGPAAYFATVPIKAMVAAMRAASVPAAVSNTAGTYVCNHLMYGVLHFLAASGACARAGFIHVPYAEEQVLDKPGIAAMSIASMARGVQAAIEAAVTHATDIRAAEGALD